MSTFKKFQQNINNQIESDLTPIARQIQSTEVDSWDNYTSFAVQLTNNVRTITWTTEKYFRAFVPPPGQVYTLDRRVGGLRVFVRQNCGQVVVRVVQV